MIKEGSNVAIFYYETNHKMRKETFDLYLCLKETFPDS
jgi:hypothetical protein